MTSSAKEMVQTQSLEVELNSPGTTWMEYAILRQHLDQARSKMKQTFYEGLNTLVVGVGFFCLFIFSFKGSGEWLVQWSLVAFEISLPVILYYEWKNVRAALQEISTVQAAFGSKKRPLPPTVNPENVGWVSLKLGKQKELVVDFDSVCNCNTTFRDEALKVKSAIIEVDQILEQQKGKDISSPRDAEDCLAKVNEIYAKALFSMWILFLNAVAVVGYAVIPMTYFYPDEENFHYFSGGFGQATTLWRGGEDLLVTWHGQLNLCA